MAWRARRKTDVLRAKRKAVQLRLAVLSLLANVEQADFRWLREKTGSTDGNLGANLGRLEEARYITVTKRFVAKKPNSVYRLTPMGRKALTSYVKALRRCSAALYRRVTRPEEVSYPTLLLRLRVALHLSQRTEQR
jgi:DNA-binding MarR family transcriptional regulator